MKTIPIRSGCNLDAAHAVREANGMHSHREGTASASDFVFAKLFDARMTERPVHSALRADIRGCARLQKPFLLKRKRLRKEILKTESGLWEFDTIDDAKHRRATISLLASNFIFI